MSCLISGKPRSDSNRQNKSRAGPKRNKTSTLKKDMKGRKRPASDDDEWRPAAGGAKKRVCRRAPASNSFPTQGISSSSRGRAARIAAPAQDTAYDSEGNFKISFEDKDESECTLYDYAPDWHPPPTRYRGIAGSIPPHIAARDFKGCVLTSSAASVQNETCWQLRSQALVQRRTTEAPSSTTSGQVRWCTSLEETRQ